jgi:hypothetical protein
MRLRAVLKERTSMRFKHYLTEDVDDIIKVINDECSLFVSKFRNKTMGLFYRAVKRHIDDFDIVKSRIDDRKPVDTLTPDHELANELFIKKFDWPVRNGAFVASDEAGIAMYGTPYIFFPCGNFDYVWSPEVNDFWGELHRGASVEKLIPTYIENQKLNQAWLDGHEISFRCNEYLLINLKYQETLLKWWKKKYEV